MCNLKPITKTECGTVGFRMVEFEGEALPAWYVELVKRCRERAKMDADLLWEQTHKSIMMDRDADLLKMQFLPESSGC